MDNCNKCTKCMYSASLHMASISGEESPYVCRVCNGEANVKTQQTVVTDYEVMMPSMNFVAAC